MTPSSTVTGAIADAAAEWRDPDHPPRSRAVAETIEAPNRWTEQAFTHALNRRMQQITVESLESWAGGTTLDSSMTVGVLHGDADPLSGFRAALAAWLVGSSYAGHLSEGSPAILPAFAKEIEKHGGEVDAHFVEQDELYERADVIIADVDDAVDPILEAAAAHDISEARCLLWPPEYSIGVLDGHETQDEMERFAEDMLLFEGKGHRRVAILFAPVDEAPDPYLQAMARFRGLFPAHADTPGTLQMQQAFLEARDEPHAYADGLQFLLSRGAPEPKRAGHIRWAEYESLDEVSGWAQKHHEQVYAVVARDDLHRKLNDTMGEDLPIRTPGGVHVPPLQDPHGKELISFLRSAAEAVV